MNYFEVKAKIKPSIPGNDLFVNYLSDLGFESFMEDEDSVLCYVQEAQYVESEIGRVVEDLKNEGFDVSWTSQFIPDQNWNEEWEKNYPPVIVSDRCIVHAPFHHLEKKYDYEILIQPKMSFGTGHHETTSLMIAELLEMDFQGKKVLDMGSGTGVLAILAAMKGATEVAAIDNDNWAYENALENVEKNGFKWIEVVLGDATNIKGRKFDCIIANINRNILLKDIPAYSESIQDGGDLLLSGFFDKDIPAISDKAKEFGLTYVGQRLNGVWTMLHFKK